MSGVAHFEWIYCNTKINLDSCNYGIYLRPLWGFLPARVFDQDPLARPFSTDADRLGLAMMREAW
jgi:hypothetical protein